MTTDVVCHHCKERGTTLDGWVRFVTAFHEPTRGILIPSGSVPPFVKNQGTCLEVLSARLLCPKCQAIVRNLYC